MQIIILMNLKFNFVQIRYGGGGELPVFHCQIGFCLLKQISTHKFKSLR